MFWNILHIIVFGKPIFYCALYVAVPSISFSFFVSPSMFVQFKNSTPSLSECSHLNEFFLSAFFIWQHLSVSLSTAAPLCLRPCPLQCGPCGGHSRSRPPRSLRYMQGSVPIFTCMCSHVADVSMHPKYSRHSFIAAQITMTRNHLTIRIIVFLKFLGRSPRNQFAGAFYFLFQRSAQSSNTFIILSQDDGVSPICLGMAKSDHPPTLTSFTSFHVWHQSTHLSPRGMRTCPVLKVTGFPK